MKDTAPLTKLKSTGTISRLAEVAGGQRQRREMAVAGDGGRAGQ